MERDVFSEMRRRPRLQKIIDLFNKYKRFCQENNKPVDSFILTRLKQHIEARRNEIFYYNRLIESLDNQEDSSSSSNYVNYCLENQLEPDLKRSKTLKRDLKNWDERKVLF